MRKGTTSESSREHRPALDGIRAIAVGSVIVYHLGFRAAQGGFLGVDLFFVLSGYLITRLLVAERLATGKVQLGRFWARRVRRLFPALVLMVAVVALLIHALLPATEWPRLEADLLWTIFYGANWHQIAIEQDYFAAWTTSSPLKHMWSLAIEEQFYLVWPLLVVVAVRHRVRALVFLALALGIAASAAWLAVLFQTGAPSRAYYGTDSRAEELLVGALLGLAVEARPALLRVGARLPVAVAAAGLLLIGVAVLLLPDSSPVYYRGGALAVSIAAAALIWGIEAAPRGWPAWVLAWGPLRWLGQVSYGLYLWHWPAITLVPVLLPALFGAAGLQFETNPALLNVTRVLAALALTALSYYAVEIPIRSGSLSRLITTPRVALYAPAAAAGLVALVVACTAIPDPGLGAVRNSYPADGQVPAASGAPVAAAPVPQPDPSTCDEAIDPVCLIHRADSYRPTVLLLGDSTAKSFVPALAQFAEAYDWTFADGSHDGCSMLQHWVIRNVGPPNPSPWQHCYDMAGKALADGLRYNPVLIIVSDTFLYVNSLDASGQLLKSGTTAHIADIEVRLTRFAEDVSATGASLVFLSYVGYGPSSTCPDVTAEPRCTAASTRVADSNYLPPYNAIFERIAARMPASVHTVDLTPAVCPGGVCPRLVDGTPVRLDGVHYTRAGALLVEPYFETRLRAAGINLG